jgi:hypothetical protein
MVGKKVQTALIFIKTSSQKDSREEETKGGSQNSLEYRGLEKRRDQISPENGWGGALRESTVCERVRMLALGRGNVCVHVCAHLQAVDTHSLQSPLVCRNSRSPPHPGSPDFPGGTPAVPLLWLSEPKREMGGEDGLLSPVN